MLLRLALVILALALLPATADARRRAAPFEDKGSSLSMGCASWGGESLNVNVGTDKKVFVVSIWGRGLQALKMGGRSVSTDGVESESGTGSGMVCAAGNTVADCQTQNVQVNFQSLDMQPGGLVSGSVSAGGETASFQGVWSGVPAQCK